MALSLDVSSLTGSTRLRLTHTHTHSHTNKDVLHIRTLVIKCKMNVKSLTFRERSNHCQSFRGLGISQLPRRQSDMTRTCHPEALMGRIIALCPPHFTLSLEGVIY